jgi:hypothetical protein
LIIRRQVVVVVAHQIGLRTINDIRGEINDMHVHHCNKDESGLPEIKIGPSNKASALTGARTASIVLIIRIPVFDNVMDGFFCEQSTIPT